MPQDHVTEYLSAAYKVMNSLPHDDIRTAVATLSMLKQVKGRLFIIGVGGSAANASHAVNDFRKIAGIETYTPVDNVSELTARTNDQGWEYTFIDWLITSHMNKNDCLLVLSVGGGSAKTSKNIVNAIIYAEQQNTPVISIVSRDGGFAAKHSTVCILIPPPKKQFITPLSESFQSVILHLLATHPDVVK